MPYDDVMITSTTIGSPTPGATAIIVVSLLTLKEAGTPPNETPVASHQEPVGLDVVYLVLGKLTRKLAGFVPGQPLEIWGPLFMSTAATSNLFLKNSQKILA